MLSQLSIGNYKIYFYILLLILIIIRFCKNLTRKKVKLFKKILIND